MTRPNGTYPDRLTVVFTPSGLACSLSSVTVVNGRDYPGDPLPLTGEGLTALNHPDLAALAEAFSTSIAAERDSLAESLASMTAERDSLAESLAAMTAERDAITLERDTAAEAAATVPTLQARVEELEALLNPPDSIWPNEFQRLLTSQQKAAIWNATEPPLTDMAADLFTIVTPMPFGEGSQPQMAVMLLGQLLPELFTPEEVNRILSRTAP